ncbi:MAG: long-chain fatty acid--CoA ligase [Actinomycetota bacterium]
MTIPGLMQTTPLTITSIFDRLRTIYGDGEIVSPERRMTYGEFTERVLKLCSALRELGVGPGDRVGSFGFNHSRHLELYYAVPLLGAVLHTINVRLFPEQITYITNHAEDKVVFFDGELAEKLAEVAPGFTSVTRYVQMGDGPDAGLAPLYDHDELVASSLPVSDLPELDENAACGICYTSGTTGMPKGVLYSHRAQWLHAMSFCLAENVGITQLDRVFPVVPLFHAVGWGIPYAAPFVGAELVFHGSDNSPQNIGRVIDEERVTVSAAVPTIWKELLPLLESGEVKATTLDRLTVGGAATPRSLIEAYDRFNINLVQGWGMTETGPLVCLSKPRRNQQHLSYEEKLDLRAKTGTIFPGIEMRICGVDGEELPWDGKEAGEIEVRGPWIASDYYNDDGLQEKFHDGWLRTGDMAVMEPDGYFKIVDRAKDLVKSGGEWISSVDLECAILAHPQVRDAAVVGVPSKKWDERPVAVVVPLDGGAPTLEEIHEFLTGKLAKWWFPDELVIVDDIPKTSVGKIDKKAIRANLAGMELE